MPGTILNTRHLPIVVSEGDRQETRQEIKIRQLQLMISTGRKLKW